MHSTIPALISSNIVIGITGRMQNGKDTAAQHMIDQFNFERFAFADSVKRVAAEAFYLSEEYVFSPDNKLLPCPGQEHMSLREVFQHVGTESFRAKWPNVWTNRVAREIAERNCRRAVITDVRFLNEATAIRQMSPSSLIIRVVNPRIPLGVASTHASETELERIEADITIMNSGSIPELHASISEVILGRFPSLRPISLNETDGGATT